MDFKKILVGVIFLFLVGGQAHSQSRQVRKKIANAEKVEVKQKKAEEKERGKKIKDHMGMQTEKTRKRMNETHKKAEKFNKRTDRTIFQRIFNKRQRKARKKYG